MRPGALLRPQGLTLLEMVFGCALLVVLLGALSAVVFISQRNAMEQSARMEMEVQARKVLHRISEDFRSGILSTLVMKAVSNSPSASMAQATGFENDTVLQGPPVEYRFQADPTDPANGVDDDGDGYTDEGVVVRSQAGAEVLIAGNVSNLNFSIVDDHLRCSISLQKNLRGFRSVNFTTPLDIRPRN